PATRFAPIAAEPTPQVPGSWQLASPETLRNAAELHQLRALRSGIVPVVLSALLVVLGLFELFVFSRRRSEPEHLWLAATAIVTAFNTFGDSYWIYELSTNLGLIRRLTEVSVHLMAALFLQLLWVLFARPMSSLLRAYQLSFAALVGFVLLAPDTTWIFRTNAVRWGWQLPALIALTWLLIGELRQRTREARIIAFGGLASLVAVGTELVWQLLGRGTLAPLGSFALAFFTASIELALSNRFSRRFLESNELRQQLEMMVEDRTSELSKANERLRAENAERRAAEEAMRMLEQAVEQSSDGIAVADMTGHLQFLNMAWAGMHGYEVYDVLGHHISLFHTPEQMQLQVGPFLARVKERGATDGEVWHRRRDGSLFPTWTSCTLLVDPSGEAMGIVAIIRDVTERRRANEEQVRLEAKLQQSQKLESLAALASGIAHD
ncbi:MAG: PAS domain S-box protein, partial [Thermoanaerobaculia bacterium]|nr:PAS domain S-box protein [Thermoanaerobaculia bacterium]